MKKILISNKAKYIIDFKAMKCECFYRLSGRQFNSVDLEVHEGKIVVCQPGYRDYWENAQPLYEEYLAEQILLEDEGER